MAGAVVFRRSGEGEWLRGQAFATRRTDGIGQYEKVVSKIHKIIYVRL